MHSTSKHTLLLLLTLLMSSVNACAEEPEFENSTFKFQSTYIWQRKASFNSPYPDGQNSLGSGLARSYTMTTTGYRGFALGMVVSFISTQKSLKACPFLN